MASPHRNARHNPISFDENRFSIQFDCHSVHGFWRISIHQPKYTQSHARISNAPQKRCALVTHECERTHIRPCDTTVVLVSCVQKLGVGAFSKNCNASMSVCNSDTLTRARLSLTLSITLPLFAIGYRATTYCAHAHWKKKRQVLLLMLLLPSFCSHTHTIALSRKRTHIQQKVQSEQMYEQSYSHYHLRCAVIALR